MRDSDMTPEFLRAMGIGEWGPPPKPKPPPRKLMPMEHPVLTPVDPGAPLEAQMRARGLVWFGYPWNEWALPGSHPPAEEPRPELRRDAGLSAAVGRESPPRSQRELPPPPSGQSKWKEAPPSSSAAYLTPEERRARGLTMPVSIEPVVGRSSPARTPPTGALQPTLPAPSPADVKRIEKMVEQIAERTGQAPPPKVPMPGTKTYRCMKAGHNWFHDPKAGRFRCHDCEHKRYLEKHPPKPPKPPKPRVAPPRRGLVARVLRKDPPMCSHCGIRWAAPRHKQCQHCLDAANAGDKKRREGKHSPEGLPAEFADVKRAGRAYLKHRPKKVTIEVTPREVEMLERYGRRG